jgi:hypothetical protein
MNDKDFEVGNVRCEHCNHNMYFSHQHSDSWNAVFYCVNPDCSFDTFMMRMEETLRNKITHLESN